MRLLLQRALITSSSHRVYDVIFKHQSESKSRQFGTWVQKGQGFLLAMEASLQMLLRLAAMMSSFHRVYYIIFQQQS